MNRACFVIWQGVIKNGKTKNERAGQKEWKINSKMSKLQIDRQNWSCYHSVCCAKTFGLCELLKRRRERGKAEEC